MISARIFISYCILSMLLLACKKENNSCFKSTGKITRETRSLPAHIKVVKLENNINLFIKQDTFNSIEIEAGKNLQDFIKTKVNGDMLTISNENKCNFLRSYKKDINAYLTIMTIDSIECNGAGDLTIADTFSTEQIVFNLSRTTGDIDVTLNCSQKSKFNLHQGSSNVTAKGYSRHNLSYNSGSGWFRFPNLTTAYNSVNSRSTGDCIVKSPELDLFIQLNGIGNVIYKGEPREVFVWEHTGSGKLIKEEE